MLEHNATLCYKIVPSNCFNCKCGDFRNGVGSPGPFALKSPIFIHFQVVFAILLYCFGQMGCWEARVVSSTSFYHHNFCYRCCTTKSGAFCRMNGSVSVSFRPKIRAKMTLFMLFTHLSDKSDVVGFTEDLLRSQVGRPSCSHVWGSEIMRYDPKDPAMGPPVNQTAFKSEFHCNTPLKGAFSARTC